MRRNPRATVLLGVALAVAVTALGQSPVAKAPKLPSSSSPAKAIPRHDLFVYLAYQGTEAHKHTRGKTVLKKIFNDIAVRAMIEALFLRFLNHQLVWVPLEARPATAAEWTAILKHIAARGVVFAFYSQANARSGGTIIVIFRGALRDESSKKIFGPIVRSLTKGSKIERVKKPGGRSVIIATRPTKLAIWNEKDADLIITDDPDAAIAAIDGKVAVPLYDPIRNQLTSDIGSEALGEAMTNLRLAIVVGKKSLVIVGKRHLAKVW